VDERDIAGIILAAGESRRMGRPKPLLEWQGGTLLDYQVAQLHDAGVADVIAVLGHAAEEIAPRVTAAGGRAVVNEGWREGRASSLRTGANAIAGAGTVVVLSVDQPRPAEVTRRLLESHANAGARITVPVDGGRRGHPVVLDGSLLPELRAVDEESAGLRAVIARHEADVLEVDFNSPVVLLDLNTPEDYAAAKDALAREVPR
jgi:molybdenum cofactor cytidylyltransferase